MTVFCRSKSWNKLAERLPMIHSLMLGGRYSLTLQIGSC